NLSIPLMIGGATTSRVHTAVKIEQCYTKDQVVHVLDASRSVTVVESLLGSKKENFVTELKADYAKLRSHHEKHRGAKEILSLEQARKNAFKIDFIVDDISVPNQLGVQEISVNVEELTTYIDWTPFFQT